MIKNYTKLGRFYFQFQILAAELSIVLFNHPSRKVFLIALIESNQKYTPTFFANISSCSLG